MRTAVQQRRIHWGLTLCIVLFVLARFDRVSTAQEEQSSPPSSVVIAPTTSEAVEGNEPLDDSTKAWNVPLPTLGGRLFWTDYRWWNGWKVQYNSTLDHWRLIDTKGVRRAWGGRTAMLDELQKVIDSSPDYVPPTEVVILAHGLFRSPGSMAPVAEAWKNSLEESNASAQNYSCISFGYASTRDPISTHSAALREVIENLPGTPRIRFVGHSLGNIVFRHACGHWMREGDPKEVLPRLDRAVMLGPPNQGSSLATQLSKLGLFETVTGSSGIHLGKAWADLQISLGKPPCPFAIVVGDISHSILQNPFLEGPSDGVVTTQEAFLEGAAEIRTFPVLHSFLMSDEAILKATVSFLQGKSLDPR